MSRDTRQKQAHLRAENKLYGQHLESIPVSRWPKDWPKDWPWPIAVYRNARFLVQVFAEVAGAMRLSVMRTMIGEDGRSLDGITWDELMVIKAECGFSAHWAVEIYPAEEATVNEANMRHIFVLSEPPAFAWRKS